MNLAKIAGILLLVILLSIFYASGRHTIKENDFVGKWKSSKVLTPIYLYDNGEWEIKKDDGAILQYGVWRYENNNIIWSYKIGSEIGHDANRVLDVIPGEFHIRESDGSETIFSKLE